ncbi:FixH family protein [Jeotgalicoccus sp. WY2]|uniref:FixH family protein n=1 Tax=Jeotgalicoccus sp. WY2 TaxID=2708346 RepID=UPI001BD6B175|nr:FixH family protein [Jeotgalicoccus sp. WY2]
MKKLLLLSGLTLALAACGNGTEEAQSEETHEPAEESADHHHEHVLDINLTVDNEADPSVVSVELLKEDEAYEADRVRFEVQEPETEEITWLNAEHQGDGVYTAETAEVEPGEYSITAHINGPEDLHEHTDDIFEIE